METSGRHKPKWGGRLISGGKFLNALQGDYFCTTGVVSFLHNVRRRGGGVHYLFYPGEGRCELQPTRDQ